MTTVVHCKKEKFDIYIGRPSKWGNPFSYKLGTIATIKTKTLEETLIEYEKWLLNQPQLLKDLYELKDKILGCWCKPKEGFNNRLLCHGQILAKLADSDLYGS